MKREGIAEDGTFACVNDLILEKSDAFIHISDLAVQRGYGVFDFFKVRQGVPMFIDFHLDRFFHSAAVMKLTPMQSRDQIQTSIFSLLEKNKLSESGIKLILTGGYSADGYSPAVPNLVITQQTLKMPADSQVVKGLKVITHPYRKEFPDAKTINYSMGIWLADVVRSSGADDVLYHHDSVVSEFPRCNVFIVTDNNVLVTPVTQILEGITRKNVLALARDEFAIQERDITLTELYAAREVFLTSTTKRVIPVVEVDGRRIGIGSPGPVTGTLLTRLIALEEAYISKSLQNQ